MANEGRSHAWLPRLKGEAGEPFLPKVGELYRVDTIIFSFRYDPAAARPAVVVDVPPASVSHSPIRLATRTSKKVPGVPHPADPALGCELDGVFSDQASVEQRLWTPRNVVFLGLLQDPYLTSVLGRFS